MLSSFSKVKEAPVVVDVGRNKIEWKMKRNKSKWETYSHRKLDVRHVKFNLFYFHLLIRRLSPLLARAHSCVTQCADFELIFRACVCVPLNAQWNCISSHKFESRIRHDERMTLFRRFFIQLTGKLIGAKCIDCRKPYDSACQTKHMSACFIWKS